MKKTDGNLLIIDDNNSVLDSLKLFLQFEYSEVKILNDPKRIPIIMGQMDFDVILLDMNFTPGNNTGEEGLLWLKNILEIDPAAVVVMFTAYGDIELAVKAIRQGATDFVLKPWENNKLISTLRSAYILKQSKKQIQDLQERQTHLKEDLNKDFIHLLGSSDSMRLVNDTIIKVSDTEANVLLLGENGTGKELIARELHKNSSRSGEIFMAVDLGTLSETLFESELFGHVKGSFTDAHEDRVGRFETASGGTLFMDEIGNLTLPLQAKLLSSLQERKISRIGSNKKIPVDIRLICATNRDLQQMITDHLFRDDLFYRINTIEIEVPPLRERGDDIILLSEYYIRHFSGKYKKSPPRISRKAVEYLMNYRWPGNVRELKHTMEKAVILCDKGYLKPEDFQNHSQLKEQREQNAISSLGEIERESIRKALRINRGNLSKTARELKIARQTLYNKMQKFGL